MGYNDHGTIINSYSKGSVTSDIVWGNVESHFFGGLVGANDGEIITCYSSSQVFGTRRSFTVGGLLGYDGWDSIVTDSYFLAEDRGGGPDNGQGQSFTDVQMRTQASFVGWDFDEVWMICEGKDYPRLRWEGVQCQE